MFISFSCLILSGRILQCLFRFVCQVLLCDLPAGTYRQNGTVTARIDPFGAVHSSLEENSGMLSGIAGIRQQPHDRASVHSP